MSIYLSEPFLIGIIPLAETISHCLCMMSVARTIFHWHYKDMNLINNSMNSINQSLSCNNIKSGMNVYGQMYNMDLSIDPITKGH